MHVARLALCLFLVCGSALADQQPVVIGPTPRSGQGDPLFTAYTKLNANDADLYAQVASLRAQITALQGISGRLAALNNGFIDGVVIGGTTPAAASFTTLNVANGISAAAYSGTLSQALDTLTGTARGTVAVRGATAWGGYTPVTSGCTFQFNGTDTICAASSPGTGAVRYDTNQGLSSGQQSQARANIVGAAAGANSDITSLSGLTTPLSVTQGGTGSGSASGARSALGAAETGQNFSITSLNGLTTPLSLPQGGTGAANPTAARSMLSAAASGANSDITSLSGLTTPLSVAQGGTGTTTGVVQAPLGQVRLVYSSATALLVKPYQGNQITINGVPQTIPSGGVPCSSTGIAAGTLTYEYLWMNGAAIACEVSTTGHATGANGVEVKSGDATRTLVGMAYVATAATFADSFASRTVASWFNRQDRTLSVAAGNYPNNTTSLTEISPAQRITVLTWADEVPDLQTEGSISGALNATITLTLAVDGSVQGNPLILDESTGGYRSPATKRIRPALSEGVHTVSPYGSVSNAANPGTFALQTTGSVRN